MQEVELQREEAKLGHVGIVVLNGVVDVLIAHLDKLALTSIYVERTSSNRNGNLQQWPDRVQTFGEIPERWMLTFLVSIAGDSLGEDGITWLSKLGSKGGQSCAAVAFRHSGGGGP